MDASEQLSRPVAIALHTRDREDDYRWCVEVFPTQMTGQLKELHRGLIADQDARPAALATFVLLDQGSRLGLLVANLKTAREDHSRTRIDDTLVLEFESQDRESVYRLTAGLLGSGVTTIQQKLLEYAEARFQQQESAQTAIEPLVVPLPAPAPTSDKLPAGLRVGLRSNEVNQKRVVGMLGHAAQSRELLERPFVVVSTGLVSKEKLQQYANDVHRFIALTRSTSVPETDDVLLEVDSPRSDTGNSSNRFRIIARPTILLVLGIVVVWAIANQFTLAKLRTENGELRDECVELRGENVRLRKEITTIEGQVSRKLGNDHMAENPESRDR